jgi:hypothetical protein
MKKISPTTEHKIELSRFHHSRLRDTQLRTRGGINAARNGVDVPQSDVRHYRTCYLKYAEGERGTRLAGGRGTEGSEVLPLFELHGGRGT